MRGAVAPLTWEALAFRGNLITLFLGKHSSDYLPRANYAYIYTYPFSLCLCCPDHVMMMCMTVVMIAHVLLFAPVSHCPMLDSHICIGRSTETRTDV